MEEQSNDTHKFSDPATREQWLEFLRKASEYNRPLTQDLPSNAANPHDTGHETA